MEYTLHNLRIRKVLLMYFICYLVPCFFKIFRNNEFFVGSLLFLLWFIRILKKNGVKISAIQSLLASVNRPQIWREFIALFCFSMAISHIMCYILGAEVPKIPTSTMLDYLGLCLFTPIIEEVIFRGVILNRLIHKIGINKALVISSFVFTILHYPIQYLHTFIFGIFLSLVYLRSKNIINTMILHILNNSFVGLILFIASVISPTTINDAGITPNEASFVLLVASILLIPSTIYISRFINNNWRLVTHNEREAQANSGHKVGICG